MDVPTNDKVSGKETTSLKTSDASLGSSSASAQNDVTKKLAAEAMLNQASSDTVAPPTLRSKLSADAATAKSWGEKYKVKTLHVIRDDVVNYVVNFLGSAIFAYKVERSKFGVNLEQKINRFAESSHTKHPGIPAEVFKHIGGFFTKTQLLLCGGHALLPFMKYTHDHKKVLEFAIGHRLDQLQELTGHGNAASKRSLQEYKVVKDLLKSKPKTLSDDEKTLLDKHGIGDNLQFNEHRSSWGHVIKARLGGMAFTTTLSVFLGISNAQKRSPYDTFNYQKRLQQPAGKVIGNWLTKIPKVGKTIADPQHLGENMFTETIYTLASKVGYDRIEHKQFKKEREEEKAAAAKSLKPDEKLLAKEEAAAGNGMWVDAAGALKEGRPSATDARKKLVEEGKQDFRTRESAKPSESAAAIS